MAHLKASEPIVFLAAGDAFLSFHRPDENPSVSARLASSSPKPNADVVVFQKAASSSCAYRMMPSTVYTLVALLVIVRYFRKLSRM